MKQAQCGKCEDREESHSQGCLVRQLLFRTSFTVPRTTKTALEKAVQALNQNKESGVMEANNAVQEVKKTKFDIGQLEDVFIKGDISSMNELQRVEYVRKLCHSLGLNPMTQPFDYIPFQGGKIQLYAKKGCTDQLRGIYGISMKIIDQKVDDGVLTVVAQASFPDGRQDEDYGCVTVGHLKGDALANARMKAVTKAKRRVTLSICGLGMLDESELETIPSAKRVEKEVNSVPVTRLSDPGQVITDKQLAKLFAMLQDCETTEEQLRYYVKEKIKVDSLKLIPIKHFDNLVRALNEGFVSKTQNPEAPAFEYAEDTKGNWFKEPHPGVAGIEDPTVLK